MASRTTKAAKDRPMATSHQPSHKGGRAGRRRLFKSVLFLAAAGAVGWCVDRAPAVLATSERFQVHALEVDGLHVMSGSDILAASGLEAGDNLFATNLRQVQRGIEQLPWVRAASVQRKPPDRLIVRIAERRRIAWLDLNQLYGVDASGVLLSSKRKGSESVHDLDLPVISGLDLGPESLAPGMIVPDSTVVEMLDWWQQVRAADNEFSLNISEIQPLGANDVRLHLVGDGLEVRLPRDRVPERIKILKALMRRVYRECPAPAYIDMRFAGQAVVGSKKRSS